MENIRKTDYLGQLTSMINKAKKELSAYVEIVDVAIASGSKGSKIVNIEYLSSISELARIYKDFDLNKNIGQIVNFLTIAETVRSIESGLMHESSINACLSTGTQIHNMLYYEVLEERSNPSNYPQQPNEYDSKLVGLLNQQEDLENRYKKESEKCKKKIFPIELLERKSSQPYIDRNGNQYDSILGFINLHKNMVSKIDIPVGVETPVNDINLSDNEVENRNKMHM
ncbi:MAG TPA: hypothetical protein IAC20_01810 [Candidatus Faecisoma merdavium]|nr:hypothetical protein [Candidatus Faecisoma merdavium]